MAQLSYLKCTVLEKIKKNPKKYPFFFAILAKTLFFLRFFLNFSEIILGKELRFLALHLVHQDASFELSKSTVGQFFRFFTHREGQMYAHH